MKGKISIGRSTGGADGDRIYLKIEDDTSGIILVDGEMTLEDFGAVITGSGYRDVEFTHGDLRLLGKTHEHKSVDIDLGTDRTAFSGKEKKFHLYMAPFIAPHEVDGWKASTYDLRALNHHRYKRVGDRYSYTVSFHRYV